MNKKTAAIYVRVSTEEQATEGFSIQAQLSELERYALQNNLDIVERYIDEGFSGKTIEGRPQMRRLLKEVKQRQFQSVLIYRTDRLSRRTKDSLEIIEIFQKNNIQLLSITENVDLSNPVGIAMFQIMSSINELERNTIITRVKMGMTERAKQGKYNGGIVLGYDAVNKELIINEDEAHIVRTIFNFAEQDMGLKAITRRLNEMGYRTKKGNPFSTLSVKNILNNPIYIGKIRFNQLENWAEKRRSGKNTDYILSDGNHDPIISIEQWENVQRIMKKRSYKPVRSHTPFILAGLLRCPECGHGMVAGRSPGSSGRIYRYYNCGQYHNKGKTVCSAHGIRADVAEKQVFDELSRIVTNDLLLKKLVQKINTDRMNAEKPLLEEKKRIESKFDKTLKKLNNLKEKIIVDTELLDMFKPNLIALQDELKTLQQQREELLFQLDNRESEPVDFNSLKKLLSDFYNVLMSVDPNEQKSLLSLIIKDIQITKDSPRMIGRRVTKINLLFDFTIEALQSDTYELLKRVYSDYDFIADFDPRLLDGVTLANFHKTGLGEVMNSLNILPLAMIRFPPINFHRAVNLLGEDEAHELVGQRHAPERQPLLRAAEHAIGEPVAAADHKRDMARPVRAEPVEFGGQFLRTPELAADGERDDMRVALDLREDPFPLALLHLKHLRLAHRLRRFLVGNLDDLKLHIGRKTLRILSDPLHQILFLQFADGNDLYVHVQSP
ncbi:hypothetical protein PbDSM24746_21210 [Paenibacillus macerans]|nr:hypothetical protein PbDSM24746_21210 [Paenibacillus macerans]GBK68426.1 hypothetical protein PbJCM17693_21340 [Paenibacillus macerans]